MHGCTPVEQREFYVPKANEIPLMIVKRAFQTPYRRYLRSLCYQAQTCPV